MRRRGVRWPLPSLSTKSAARNRPRAPVHVPFVEVFTNAFDSLSTPLSIRLCCRAGGQGVHNADWNPKFGL